MMRQDMNRCKKPSIGVYLFSVVGFNAIKPVKKLNLVIPKICDINNNLNLVSICFGKDITSSYVSW